MITALGILFGAFLILILLMGRAARNFDDSEELVNWHKCNECGKWDDEECNCRKND